MMLHTALERFCDPSQGCAAAIDLFENVLRFPIQRVTDLPVPLETLLKENYRPSFSETVQTVFFPGLVSEEAFDGVGGKSVDEALVDAGLDDYQGMALFVMALKSRRKDRPPTRTCMADLTRAFNRSFSSHPVVVLFCYHCENRPWLSLATCERTTYKQTWREGEKPGRISLLRHIDPARPHAGHQRILNDLRIERKGRKAVRSFRALYDQWRAVFDTDVLSGKFYKELSDWFFWACREVVFPGGPDRKDFKGAAAHAEALQAHKATHVIRLVIRLLFTWFLKEKGLVARELFEKEDVDQLLKTNGDGSKYYKAVLQNLFFATFNQEIGKREFRKQNGSRSHHYNVTNLYRYEKLFRNPDAFFDLQRRSPFLNCGLFECLDKPAPDQKTRQGGVAVTRVDGFSDRSDNPLHVPDDLFWGEETEIDLGAEYGEKKAKYCRVRGLIPILHAYKFTIDENTPLEQDIALDPELLGKVFENLLAAYNPETRTTARKQTGSFYTPREIVDYMVTESLVSYLAGAVSSMAKSDAKKRAGRKHLRVAEAGPDLEELLRQLLKESDVQPFVDAPLKQAVIEALSRVKILDPACGSGAFPMGVLHRVVQALKKLDSDNVHWRSTQLKIAMEEVQGALQEEDKGEREKRLKEISDAFEQEAFDYTRKLYLIENCIYGVDIQPIAVEISRLRFFISLMVDQESRNDPENNHGIKPLPNLETRFVAANALIGLQRQQQFKSKATEAVEQALEENRHRHFNAKTWKTKLKYRTRDRELRKALETHLRENGWAAGLAQKIAGWNPYDVNVSSDFFDPEWMFGVDDGFDVVIGNPPYVRQEKITALKPQLKAQYPRFASTADLYVYFFDQALELMRPGGVLCFITSNKYFRSGYGKNLRAHLGRHTRIRQIIDFGDAPVFTSIAYPSIFLAEKEPASAGNELLALNWQPDQPVDTFEAVFARSRFPMPQEELKADSWQLASPRVLGIMKKLKAAGVPLGQYVNGRFYYGIKTGLNEAFVIDRTVRDRLITEDPASVEIIKPLLRGRDVKRYKVTDSNLWLIFTRRGIDIDAYPAIKKHLLNYKKRLMPGCPGGRKPGPYEWYEIQDNIAYWKEFDFPKIVYPDIYEHQSFALDLEGRYLANTCYFIPEGSVCLCALLNSMLIEWYYRRLSNSIRGGYLRAFSAYMEQLPIAKADSFSGTPKIESLANRLMENSAQNVTDIEAELDARIAVLYGLTQDEYATILADGNRSEVFCVAALNSFEDIQREEANGPTP